MKKLVSVLLAFFLLGALAVPSFAASAVTADTSVVVSEDGVLTLTVSVPEGSGLATFESTLQYDAAVLEVQEVTYGAGNMTTSNTDTAGQIGLFMIWTKTQETAATLVTVTFRVTDSDADATSLTFTDTAATDNDDNAVNFSFANGDTLEVALSEEQTITDADIPSTAGRYVAIGGAAAVAITAIVVTTAVVKRRRSA